ncbi:MAG: FAD-binding oxidoreductase, partial [Actinobacteria bacterium]|nr:FAD-binding oxidoreductase [Actinomycetota bacterium]
NQIAETMGWASSRGMAVAAVGGGTKLGFGNPPVRLDLVLDMSAMDSVVELDSHDLVVTAQAGANIQQLRALVREDSLVLPIDPQFRDQATLGGVIACADHGPRRRQYGSLRDLVLGVKAVLPDGSSVSFGGRTLKNVAGYDVGRLFIGSLGTMGIITEATVRLLPSSASDELLFVSLPGLEDGRRLAKNILESVLIPSSLELISPAGAELLGFARLSPSPSYLMLIAAEGHPAAVERHVREISAFCREMGSNVGVRRAHQLGLTSEGAWDMFAQLRQRALGAGYLVGLHCSVPLAQIWDVAEAVERLSPAYATTAAYTMSCGTGCMELHVAGSLPGLLAHAEQLREEAENREGALTLLSGGPELGGAFDAWGSCRSDYGLIRALKGKYDPRGIMNPGRFVGGL